MQEEEINKIIKELEATQEMIEKSLQDTFDIFDVNFIKAKIMEYKLRMLLKVAEDGKRRDQLFNKLKEIALSILDSFNDLFKIANKDEIKVFFSDKELALCSVEGHNTGLKIHRNEITANYLSISKKLTKPTFYAPEYCIVLEFKFRRYSKDRGSYNLETSFKLYYSASKRDVDFERTYSNDIDGLAKLMKHVTTVLLNLKTIASIISENYQPTLELQSFLYKVFTEFIL